MGSFLVEKRWSCTFDPTFESDKRRKARGASLFDDDEVNDINQFTDPVAFDTLLQDESLSEDVPQIMRMKYEATSTCLFHNGQKSRKSFGACKTLTHVFFQRLSILTVDFKTSHAVSLTEVSTLESFTLILFFPGFGRNLDLTSGLVQRTLHVAHSCDEHTCFPWSFCCLVNSAEIPSTVFILLDSAETLMSGVPA